MVWLDQVIWGCWWILVSVFCAIECTLVQLVRLHVWLGGRLCIYVASCEYDPVLGLYAMHVKSCATMCDGAVHSVHDYKSLQPARSYRGVGTVQLLLAVELRYCTSHSVYCTLYQVLYVPMCTVHIHVWIIDVTRYTVTRGFRRLALHQSAWWHSKICDLNITDILTYMIYYMHHTYMVRYQVGYVPSYAQRGSAGMGPHFLPQTLPLEMSTTFTDTHRLSHYQHWCLFPRH